MTLPQTLTPSLPLGSDSPRGGDDELRNLKQFLADVFGLPVSPTQITAAITAITSGGNVSFLQEVVRRKAPVKAVVAAYSLTLDDETILLNKATVDTITPLAAASAPGKYYKLKNINTGTWTWSGTVIIFGASTVDPTIAQNEELEVWCDGTSYYGKKFSATPAANTVPVRKSASPYAVADAELAMTGEVSNQTITSGNSLSQMTVTAGDYIFISIYGYTSGAGTTSGRVVLNYTGTAIAHTLVDSMAISLESVAVLQKAYPSGNFIFKVTVGGTITFTSTITNTGAGGGATYDNKLYAFFLKKQ